MGARRHIGRTTDRWVGSERAVASLVLSEKLYPHRLALKPRTPKNAPAWGSGSGRPARRGVGVVSVAARESADEEITAMALTPNRPPGARAVTRP